MEPIRNVLLGLCCPKTQAGMMAGALTTAMAAAELFTNRLRVIDLLFMTITSFQD
jgi:hypothetical protein